MSCLVNFSRTARGAFRADLPDFPGRFVEAETFDALLDAVRDELKPILVRTAMTEELSVHPELTEEEELAALAALSERAPSRAVLDGLIKRLAASPRVGYEPGWDDEA